jgi:hypothetical protein
MAKKVKKHRIIRRRRLSGHPPAILIGIGYPWFELTNPWCVGTIRMYKDKDNAHTEVNLNIAGIRPTQRYRMFLEEYD